MGSTVRLRYLLATEWRRVALALVVLGAVLLGGTGWAYATPAVTETTDSTDRQTVSLAVEPSAVVTGDSPLYDRGATLDGAAVYLTDAAPELRVDVGTTAADAAAVRATHRVDLVYEAVRDGDVFWSRTVPLGAGDGPTTVSVSIPEVGAHLADYRDAVGDAGRVRASLRVTSDYETDRYDDTLTATVPLTLGASWYRLAPTTVETHHSTPVVSERTVRPLSTTGYAAVGVVGLLAWVGAIAIVRRYRDAAPNDADRAEVHADRYADWISTGTLPPDHDGPVVDLIDLEAVVDVAVDTGGRVVYDSATGRYAVFADGVQYRYVLTD